MQPDGLLTRERGTEMRLTMTREFYIPKGSTKVAPKDAPGLVFYLYEGPSRREPSRVVVGALAFFGRANKPLWHYTFRDAARRETAIREQITSTKATLAYKTKRRDDIKAERSKPIADMGKDGYVSVADTARLIRARLKTLWPTVAFSVRSSSYSGGASIDVAWTDGPTQKQVERAYSPYIGGGFDGMIDMKYSVRCWLMPDGTAAPAKSEGTTGSRGVYEGYSFPAPSLDARLVHFGADHIFARREVSKEFEAKCAPIWEAMDSQKRCDLHNGIFPRWEHYSDAAKLAWVTDALTMRVPEMDEREEQARPQPVSVQGHLKLVVNQ